MYLGVIIDKSLSGAITVESIVKKVNSRLKFLFRQARFLDAKCKMSLCSALVLWTMHVVAGIPDCQKLATGVPKQNG